MPGWGDVLWCCYLVSVCASAESMRNAPFLMEVSDWARGIFKVEKMPRRFLIDIPILTTSAKQLEAHNPLYRTPCNADLCSDSAVSTDWQ
jgi:hypothetical protein